MAFVVPYLLIRIMMMVGNWGQHAFIDPSRPGDSYANSITCINGAYNARCFNDGYHIGHHVKQNRHWSEMPKDFEDNLAKYQAEGCIVFETPASGADRRLIGSHMGGGDHGHALPEAA